MVQKKKSKKKTKRLSKETIKIVINNYLNNRDLRKRRKREAQKKRVNILFKIRQLILTLI